MKTLKIAQAEALQIINEDPKLELEKNKLFKKQIEEKFTSRIEI